MVFERLKIQYSQASTAHYELQGNELSLLVLEHRAQVIFTWNTKGGDA